MLLLCNYYVTYRCNAFCEFCHFADHKQFADHPQTELEDYKKNLLELSDLGVKFIDLTGGEPLLNKSIGKMAAFASGLNIQTSITTNALLYKKYAEELAGNVNLLHFSLDSPDPEEHDKIRKIKCFDKVIESIDIAKSLGEFPDLLFTVTDETYHKLPRMHELASKHGLILIVNPVFSYFGNPGLSLKALDYIEEYTSSAKDVYINGGFIKLRRNGGNNIEEPSCKAVSRVIVITPNNEVMLPCYHLGNKSIKIENSIAELRKTEDYKYYKKNEGKFDFCQGCTINCYFEPSFAFPTSAYGIASVTSKFKYSFSKLVKQKFKNMINK